MFNLITQQRRGTTEEWMSSAVIPRVGEFIIEECSDGTRKIILGDGIHLFKDLPYIDSETVRKLDQLIARYEEHVAYVEGGSPVPDSSIATEVLDARTIDGETYSSFYYRYHTSTS